MASAPNSPQMRDEDKENVHSVTKVAKKLSSLNRRHSLAPSRSILKNSHPVGETETNHTVTIMQQTSLSKRGGGLKTTTTQALAAAAANKTSNRRVSFAPEVTLHKIDMIPQFFEQSPRREPRRRDTIQFVPSVKANGIPLQEQLEKDSSSDMDVDHSAGNNDIAPQSVNPFMIFHDTVEEDEEEEEDNFDGLREETAMELTTYQGKLKVDEMDGLKPVSQEENENEDMELTGHGPQVKSYNNIATENNNRTEDQDMELTKYNRPQAHDVEELDMELTKYGRTEQQTREELDMELTKYGRTEQQTREEVDMDITTYQGAKSYERVEEDMELTTVHVPESQSQGEMELTTYHGSQATLLAAQNQPSQQQPDVDEMEITVYHGSKLPSQGPLAHSTQSQSHSQSQSQPLQTQEVPILKNPQLERVKRQPNSSFDSTIEEHDTSMEVTTTAFGDPSIFEEILRIAGASQDDEVSAQSSDKLVESTTPAKRAYSTPRKLQTTTAGSPQERQSSSKKRRLSFANTEEQQEKSPISVSRTVQSDMALEIGSVPHHTDTPATPVKESLLLGSPSTSSRDNESLSAEKITEPSSSQPSIREMIKALTPNRTKRRESGVLYVSKSPRRDSLTDGISNNLTPLRKSKEQSMSALNMAQATVIPLTGGSEDEDHAQQDDDGNDPDISDDYMPIDLKTFFKASGIKFYDDLNVRDSFNEMDLTKFDNDNDANLADYLKSLQKLKRYELINFTVDEMKKNIAEGAEQFSNVEREIAEMNPPLIREYMEADGEVQQKMSMQFQVLKNFARQQAKNNWYNWRLKVISGIEQDLLQNERYLNDNRLKIQMQIDATGREKEELLAEFQLLKERFNKLSKHKQEFENCNKDELLAMRSKLILVLNKVEERQIELNSLIDQNKKLVEELTVTVDKNTALSLEIEEIKSKIRDNKFYSLDDVKQMKLTLSILEKASGLKLVEILPEESNIIHLKVEDGIEMEYDLENNTVQFQFNRVEMNDNLTLILAEHLVDNDNSVNANDKVSNYMMKFRELKVLRTKLINFQMRWDGVLKINDLGSGMAQIVIKDITSTMSKNIYTFEINAKSLNMEWKLQIDDIKVTEINYYNNNNNNDNDEPMDNTIEVSKNLKDLLTDVKLI